MKIIRSPCLIIQIVTKIRITQSRKLILILIMGSLWKLKSKKLRIFSIKYQGRQRKKRKL